MDSDSLVLQLHQRAGTLPDADPDADSLIGFFQAFRPDGTPEQPLFTGLIRSGDASLLGSNGQSVLTEEIAEALDERLVALYRTAGDNRRPGGGKDAYFVVRQPQPIDPDVVESLAEKLIEDLAELASVVGDAETASLLGQSPRIRVLEGLPPKHPKRDDEKTSLLRAMQQEVPQWVSRLDVGGLAGLLRPAYYFIACDPLLRDYLMWPLYRESARLADPFLPYFQLWRHGVKYRVFQEDQIDFYLPRGR
jgi:hypothetical protein